MSDEDFDEAPKADTKGARRPKRDRNQPFPKARPSVLGKVIKLGLGGLVAVVLLWGGMYSAQVGKAPHQWSGEDWAGFLTFSKQQVDEARQNVESVDWNALKDKITEKTKQLWNEAPEWEKKLEAKLAELRGQRATTTPGKSQATTTPPPGTTGPATTTAASVPPAAPAAPGEFEQGCEAMQKAIAVYRKSVSSQAELKRAKGLFHQASEHFEAAHAEATARGDAAAVQEIEGYMQQCNQYLIDCSKREKV